MSKILLAIVVAVMVLSIGFLMFPNLHTILGQVPIVGFSELGTVGMILFPYVLLGFVIYVAVLAFRSK